MKHLRPVIARSGARDSSGAKPVIALLLLVLLNTLILWPINLVQSAEPPFDVRRSESPDLVKSQSPHATNQTAAFEDAVGVLYDGSDYYYIADAADGTPLTLTVSKLDSLGSLRIDVSRQLSSLDQAIVRLQTMVERGGTLDQIRSGLNPFSDPGAGKVAEAHLLAATALWTLRLPSTAGDADAVGTFLKEAVGMLLAAAEDPGQVDPDHIAAAIAELTQTARLAAVHYLEAAWAACGSCSGGQPGDLCDAEAALRAGDDALLGPDPHPEQAVTLYGTCLESALAALSSCG